MRKWISALLIVLSLCLALGVTGVVVAQDVRPSHSDPGWQASYWNNPSLNGAPVVQRFDPDLNFAWGPEGTPAAPDPAINADRFSARWLRYIDVAPGAYRFTATSDDGMRVWVDGELIIDMWSDHATLTRTADRVLGPGHHLVQVEYYENTGAAVAQLSWSLADVTIGGWRGEYFNNRSLSGAPALVRDEREINFNWGNASPSPGQVEADNFSVRWTRSIDLPPGNYRFSILVDDGARLFVNGHTLIDAWHDQPARTYTGDIYLPGGGITVHLEYYENGGSAVAQLRWERSGASEPPPPSNAVTVDDRDAGFVRGGNPRGWRFEPEGHNGTLTWTRNNDRARPNYNWGRWYPRLQPGRYEVFVYIPDRFTTSSQARYWVSHGDGLTLRVVDQSAKGGQWVSLGAYTFQGDNNDYVSLADVTYEPYVSRLIAWDAVRWEPR